MAALSTLGTPDPVDDEPASDTTAPVISDIGGSRSGGSLTLWWTTDEPATSEVEFEGYGVYGDTDSLKTDHEQGFTVDAGETYTFRVIATDAAGNTSTSVWWITSP